MKCTIINCDMCGGRIYKDGWFAIKKGAIILRAKELRELTGYDFNASGWKRQEYHICPKCVEKIKEYCSGGANG